jgi:D-tyrosyl-tRNA(Tyr) deacylase
MKLIIQRVKSASVVRHSDKKQFGKIGQGLFVLVGFKKGDDKKTVELLADKLLKLRIMSDDKDKMNLSVVDTKSEILIVSQFTLYADTKGGNRPSFIDAEEPQKARELYEYFIDKLKEMGVGVETGSFGDYMDISVELDGPVTIIL